MKLFRVKFLPHKIPLPVKFRQDNSILTEKSPFHTISCGRLSQKKFSLVWFHLKKTIISIFFSDHSRYCPFCRTFSRKSQSAENFPRTVFPEYNEKARKIKKKSYWNSVKSSSIKFPLESSLPEISLPVDIHPKQKSPSRKMCVCFPIANTMRKQWTNFISQRPIPWDCGGHVIYERILFNYAEKMAI